MEVSVRVRFSDRLLIRLLICLLLTLSVSVGLGLSVSTEKPRGQAVAPANERAL